MRFQLGETVMNRSFALILAVGLGLTSTTNGQQTVPPAASEAMRLGLRGVYFVPNQGQWSDDEVFYGFRSRGLDVAFRESSLTMHLARERRDPGREPGRVGPSNFASDAHILNMPDIAPLPDVSDSFAELAHLTLTITFPGSNPVAPSGAQPQAARFNYFVGGDGRASRSDLPSYSAVVYKSLYDGIDMFVCGNDTGVLKYEFHVAPGANHSQIRIAYDGIDSLCVKESGDLEISTSFGTLMDKAPQVWHDDPMTRVRGTAARPGIPTHEIVPAHFDLIDEHTYRIVLDGAVDPASALIIDPDVEWMRYLGGRGGEEGFGVAVDRSGDTLVTGNTNSDDFDGRSNSRYGDNDAFVLKVSPSSQLIWMTYVGGSAGDYAEGLALDNFGNAMVSGRTLSSDFDGRNNAYHGGGADAFLAKLDATGVVQWMTYLGGTDKEHGRNSIPRLRIAVAVDAEGSGLVSGTTRSIDFEGRLNEHHGGRPEDVFLVKVDSSGLLQWMVYLGGTDQDRAGGIALDRLGDALVCGTTTSMDFEGRTNSNGAENAFIVKVNPSGVLQWMTYLGGTVYEVGEGIAIDSGDNALLTGVTSSHDFVGRNNRFHGNRDAFVAKVSPSGVLHWMTYLGGSYIESGTSIAADGAGGMLVTGWTASDDFEGRRNAFRGYGDAFVVNIGEAGNLHWMSYLGGSGDDQGWAVALDTSGCALVAGGTTSDDFEGRVNSQFSPRGWWDAFLVKFRLDGADPQLTVAPTCPSGGPIRIEWSGATPGGQVALIFARNTGSFRIPNNMPCAGTQLGLGSNQIQLAFQGSAGPNGSRTLNATAGPAACGGHLQLLDLTPCATSNVVRIE